ncbi:class I SAM-dependent methyltransferase [Tundrisphaera sp. TA3]|uniref:class I SAM-dependent methyltransferase n=1 Tax=Tundrisphaera sp. TA3 TaxID=3435775 RepID=UPI003EBA0891
MNLLDDATLERSAVVANCRMNRERALVGPNGYGRELGFNPLDVLRERAGSGHASWLDLCCGSGRALIEAARVLHAEGLDPRVEIVGIDLVGMFFPADPAPTWLRLVEASLSNWRPDRPFDLITCVHGLHYVGDKLGLIARATSWLADGSRFAASLDPVNLKFADDPNAGPKIVAGLRSAGLEFDRRRRLIARRGRMDCELPYRYLGADDQAGPNSTGQPAVDSYYRAL